MVKIFTTKKNRFGRIVNIEGINVSVDNAGNAEIEDKYVSQALIAGFELVDKTVKFATEEEKKQIEDVQNILESAKSQAKEIIAEAEKKAGQIVSDAEKKAGIILAENHVSEKESKTEELESKTVKELQALCIEAGIEESKYKYLKKEELVNLLISYIFDEK